MAGWVGKQVWKWVVGAFGGIWIPAGVVGRWLEISWVAEFVAWARVGEGGPDMGLGMVGGVGMPFWNLVVGNLVGIRIPLGLVG